MQDHVQRVGAVQARGVDQVVRDEPKVLAEQENRVRRAKHEGQHQCPECVAQPQLGHHQIERHHRDCARHHHCRDVDPKQRVASGELQAPERVGGQYRKRHLAQQNHRGHQRRHRDGAAEPGAAQVGVIGHRRRPWQLQRRTGDELVRRGERGQQAKQKGHQGDQRTSHQAGVDPHSCREPATTDAFPE